MPYLNVWLHLVWSTKERIPFLQDSIRDIVFNHIWENARNKDLYLDSINGYLDHVHCLASLTSEMTISKLTQLIKGESSYWINRNNLCPPYFEWQVEYYAASVSPWDLNKIRKYIDRQVEHHQKKSFQQELDEFLIQNNLDRK